MRCVRGANERFGCEGIEGASGLSVGLAAWVVLAGIANGAPAPATSQTEANNAVVNPAPTAADWAALAKPPDWSGVWAPAPLKDLAAVYVEPPSWTPEAQARVERMRALGKAGTPENIYLDGLPEGMPSFDIMTLNAAEFLFTPGR